MLGGGIGVGRAEFESVRHAGGDLQSPVALPTLQRLICSDEPDKIKHSGFLSRSNVSARVDLARMLVIPAEGSIFRRIH